ncbi:hypothetical protein D3C71_1568050 [compost metagenome]
MAERDDLFALRLAARDHVRQPFDDVGLVREHLVVALVARAGEVIRTDAGGHIDVGVDANQPDALYRFHHVGRVRNHLA